MLIVGMRQADFISSFVDNPGRSACHPQSTLTHKAPVVVVYPGGSGIDSLPQIFRASKLAISACRGTASAWPVSGFSQRVCYFPSRRSTQPWRHPTMTGSCLASGGRARQWFLSPVFKNEGNRRPQII